MSVIEKNFIETQTESCPEIVLAIAKQLQILDTDTPYDIRCKIKTLSIAAEKFLKQHNIESIALPVNHLFADKVYVREMYIPAGLLIVGKIHKEAHIFQILSGDVTFVQENNGLKRYIGPCMFQVPGGIQKVLLTHTDIHIATFTSTDITDVNLWEAENLTTRYEDVGKAEPEVEVLELLSMYEQYEKKELSI